MRVIPLVALNVFKESVRDKVLYNLILFAVLLIASSYLLGQLSAGQDVKIVKDLGLAATSIFGGFIAVFIGVGLVSKEIERRTLYSLLAKPIRRYEFVLGKYFGLVLTLLVNVAVMTAALYAVLLYMSHRVEPVLLKAIVLIMVELMVLTAVALFFSTFSTPILSAVFTFGLFITGHFNQDLKHFENVVSAKPAIYLARVLYYLVPNLMALDVKSEVVHAQPVPAGYIVSAAGYGLLYVAFVLVAATVIFQERNFK